MESETSIGLAELIQQVKLELLTIPPNNTEPPLFSVDSVELELQVTVKREGKGSVKINVVSIGGAELGGGASHDAVQKVKVTLSPLFDKAKLMEFYQTLRPDQVMPTVKSSLEAILKGNQGNLNEEFGG